MNQDDRSSSIQVVRRRAILEAPVLKQGPPGTSPSSGGVLAGVLRAVFLGGAALAILGVVASLLGSLWLTANQRAEAEKREPWANPSFTTTAVTTGGLLAKWMDSDGNLANGHSYVKGIYDLWKGRYPGLYERVAKNARLLPQLWMIEFNADLMYQASGEAAELERQYKENLNVISEPWIKERSKGAAR